MITRKYPAMQKPNLPTLEELRRCLPRWIISISWLLLIVILAYTYRAAIRLTFTSWWNQPEYGHGFFVVPFALVLLLRSCF